ncbi:MAG: ribosome biogenesis GTPase Der [Bacteroidota bacterium]|nr:ribosome biogenesis GTPase Der [Bacteroidota bacterium]MDE2835329.1 ribosome biogenesis GTPase Der [Bacteroidota bacterium]
MPLAALVGRPNVGKSTLFNRLTETREAIVHDAPGVTRDRLFGEVEWNGRTFRLVDTGGFVPRSAERFEKAIREQVELALEEADVILLVTDVTTGITDVDLELARHLQRGPRPVMVLANKSDNVQRRWQAAGMYKLGLKEVFPISGTNGMGTGELLDALVAALPPDDPAQRPAGLRIALIGRPNVGKSLLTNALLNSARAIVTEIGGTTRDAVDTPLTYRQQPLVLVDTAGLRRRTRVKENVEFYATLRTEKAVRECDVAVLLIDATQRLEAQDIAVLKQAEARYKGLILAVNKWDLIEKETNTARDRERAIRNRLRTLDYVPVVFVSALTRQRIYRILDMSLKIEQVRHSRIATASLNRVLQMSVQQHYPPTWRNRHVQIKYVTQTSTAPPVFTFFCNHPQGVHESYVRYLENRLRAAFDFTGVPVRLRFRKKSQEPD